MARLQNGLFALLNARAEVLAFRTSAGVVTCVDRRDYRAIRRGSRAVRAWVALFPPGTSLEERRELGARALKKWQIRVPTRIDVLELDRARLRALQAARVQRLEAKADALKPKELRMKTAA